MRKLIYVAHAFRNNPTANAARVRAICAAMKHTYVPLAPHLLLPWYLDEATERSLALAHCVRLVAAADELQVFGPVSEGMANEIAEAQRLGIPVIHVEADNESDPRVAGGRSGGVKRC